MILHAYYYYIFFPSFFKKNFFFFLFLFSLREKEKDIKYIINAANNYNFTEIHHFFLSVYASHS